MILVADRFQLPFPKSTFGNRFGVKGPNYGPQGHRGTDFVVAQGNKATAIANGRIVHVMWSNALGNVVVVKHFVPGGGDANDVFSGYCHLLKATARIGADVKIGGQVGLTGTTGTASTGPHLHLTMSHDDMGVEYGEVFDPIAYIEAHTRPLTAPAKVMFTTARKGEGLSVIAARVGLSLGAIEKLNPGIRPPSYVIQLGQKIRIK